MSKKNRTLISITAALLMVVVMSVPVFADGDAGLPEEAGTTEEPSKFVNHPVVQLFAEFFASFFNPPVEEVDPTPDAGAPPEGEGTPPAEGEPPAGDGTPTGEGEGEGVGEPEAAPVVPEVEIAAMHEEDKLGFGEIAKLTGIAKMAQETCAETGELCEVTLDSLMTEYKGGMGVGNLFKKYGKPDNLGVGQIRKEMDPKEKTNNGKVKDK